MPPYVEQITVDVTHWPRGARRKLQLAVRVIEAELAVEPTAPTSGWDDIDTISTMLNRLAVTGRPVQAKAIMRAIENGGEVSRAEVYRLGGYGADRSLKGFTRPVNRIVQEMKDAGDLPVDAEVPFEPIYDPNKRGYQPAQGFRVRSELVEAYLAA